MVSRLTTNAPTCARGVLQTSPRLAANSLQLRLYDINGRQALDLVPGPNDVSRRAPGVCFLRGLATGDAHKVVTQRWRLA
jgi:hypothetical protein